MAHPIVDEEEENTDDYTRDINSPKSQGIEKQI